MSSSRLPGKVLKPILGKPMIWHQWQRMLRATQLDHMVLATSDAPSDDVLTNFCAAQQIPVFRGNLTDVLSRYYYCASEYNPEHVVRLTGDCPLIDPTMIDELILTHLSEGNDYTSIGGETYPLGLSAEAFRFDVLQHAYQHASTPPQREHVTLYMYQHEHLFKVKKMRNNRNLSHLRLTVDYPEDFALVTQIFEALYPTKPDFDTHDVLELLEKNPTWCLTNTVIESKER